MKSASNDGIALTVALAFVLLSVSGAGAVTKERTCRLEPGLTLQHFLDEINPGDTLLVSGTCNENADPHTGRHHGFYLCYRHYTVSERKS
jgi:hypothetical protein